MRPRISIRGCVRLSVRSSVRNHFFSSVNFTRNPYITQPQASLGSKKALCDCVSFLFPGFMVGGITAVYFTVHVLRSHCGREFLFFFLRSWWLEVLLSTLLYMYKEAIVGGSFLSFSCVHGGWKYCWQRVGSA